MHKTYHKHKVSMQYFQNICIKQTFPSVYMEVFFSAQDHRQIAILKYKHLYPDSKKNIHLAALNLA